MKRISAVAEIRDVWRETMGFELNPAPRRMIDGRGVGKLAPRFVSVFTPGGEHESIR